jgi:hypothetical protein
MSTADLEQTVEKRKYILCCIIGWTYDKLLEGLRQGIMASPVTFIHQN